MSHNIPSEQRRWPIIAIAAVVLYAALLGVTWMVSTARAARQTKSMLDYAMLDLDATLNGAIDTMLMHAAESIAADLGEAGPLDSGRMVAIAERSDMDEVNIVTQDGRIVATTDPRILGVNMADKPTSAEFLILTNGVRQAFSQPFRNGASNPDVRRKYVGVPFPGGRGYVQVGIDETRVTRMFPAIVGFIFDGWLLGEKGFFLCADLGDGHLLSNPARHRDEARFLHETGYDPDDPRVVEDAKTTFHQRLFGDVCDCRAVIFCGHRVIAALPPAEFYTTRTIYTAAMALVLLFVFSLFVLLFRRIDNDAARLKSFYDAEDEQRSRDLAIAKTIQNAALPNALPDSPHFRLYAEMDAAREVGGDFYDHFPLDATHYAFLVADVSGKGITAALYMMTAKTLIKDRLLATRDPAAALTQVNAELCRNNPASMFLTVWAGVLDIETGDVAFANAGHNPPVVLVKRDAGAQGTASEADDDGPFAAPSFLTAKSGPMLAFMDGIQYKARHVTLEKGAALFIYTDGVTEALDPNEELFGDERLSATLRTVPTLNPDDIALHVRTAVTAFAAGTPQADDITVLAVRYVSAPRTFSRSFPPTPGGVAEASDFLDTCLEGHLGQVAGVDPGALMALSSTLHIILDEICSNIVKHSGASGFVVDVEFAERSRAVILTFFDDGKAYDPIAHADPDTTLPADKRPIGGLGILMVKKMSDDIRYTRSHNRNILTVVKNL